jgi:hypothetical protein
MKPTDDHSIRTAVRDHYESVVKESEAKKSQVNCCAPSCCGADEASSKMGYSPERDFERAPRCRSRTWLRQSPSHRFTEARRNCPRSRRRCGLRLFSGGRLAISDAVALKPVPETLAESVGAHASCISGATELGRLEAMLTAAGFSGIQITVNERGREFIRDWLPDSGAEEFVASAVIQATKNV